MFNSHCSLLCFGNVDLCAWPRRESRFKDEKDKQSQIDANGN